MASRQHNEFDSRDTSRKNPVDPIVYPGYLQYLKKSRGLKDYEVPCDRYGLYPKKRQVEMPDKFCLCCNESPGVMAPIFYCQHCRYKLYCKEGKETHASASYCEKHNIKYPSDKLNRVVKEYSQPAAKDVREANEQLSRMKTWIKDPLAVRYPHAQPHPLVKG